MPDRMALAFDFGMKRIGVAVGSTVLNQAKPLACLSAQDGVPDWQKIETLIKEWGINVFVVGIPIHIDGTMQHTTHAAKKFAKKLTHRFGLLVEQVDERLTTVEARQTLFDEGGYKKIKQSEIDSYAAKLILEQWLNQKNEASS